MKQWEFQQFLQNRHQGVQKQNKYQTWFFPKRYTTTLSNWRFFLECYWGEKSHLELGISAPYCIAVIFSNLEFK